MRLIHYMKKLSIVVPYRDREEHLSQFLPHMKKFLSENLKETEWKIFIVEQFDDKPFNRAKLLNVGYLESREYDYFCFHDVDMLPDEADYSFVDLPTHMASNVEQFGWKLMYEGYFGGVTMFDKKSFEKINGYANDYWGWGAEDDDVLARCQIMEIQAQRKKGVFRSLPHEREINKPLYEKNLNKLNMTIMRPSEEKIMKDGLNTISYEKIKEEDLTDFCKKIYVSL
jgi:hypothetical protein